MRLLLKREMPDSERSLVGVGPDQLGPEILQSNKLLRSPNSQSHGLVR